MRIILLQRSPVPHGRPALALSHYVTYHKRGNKYWISIEYTCTQQDIKIVKQEYCYTFLVVLHNDMYTHDHTSILWVTLLEVSESCQISYVLQSPVQIEKHTNWLCAQNINNMLTRCQRFRLNRASWSHTTNLVEHTQWHTLDSLNKCNKSVYKKYKLTLYPCIYWTCFDRVFHRVHALPPSKNG